MKRIILGIVIAASVGCGGGGSSTPSPFAGTWSPNVSTGALSVGLNGHFTMTIDDSTIGGVDTYVGNISNVGNISGTMTNSGVPGVTLKVSGTTTVDSATQISMVLTVKNTSTGSSSSASESFTLVATPVAHPRVSTELSTVFGRVTGRQ